MSFALAAATLTCVETRPLPPCDPSSALTVPPRDPSAAVVVAAGDIADCPAGHQDETAALVERIAPDAVLTLGDTVYPNGSLDDFLDCYGPSWGRFRSITRPAVGNHDYHAAHAGPFYAYFCGAAGPPFRGYTSFDIGTWHVVVLNSNCGPDIDLPEGTSDEFGGCGPDSPQAKWLRDDLRAHPNRCTLAMMHHPRFTSSRYGNHPFVQDLWSVLYEGGVDVALGGHAHLYERLAPMTPDGTIDDARGIRSFVVGTGGRYLVPFGNTVAGSERRDNESFGVLRLVLRPDSADYAFVAVEGRVIDEGSFACH